MTPSLLRYLREFARVRRELREFARTGSIPCDGSRLLDAVTESDLEDVFRSDQLEKEWNVAQAELGSMRITDSAGGVNPGDRRAIFYLIGRFRPQSVLEIGTHIGASTMHIAAALKAADSAGAYASTLRLTTVDLVDVNDSESAMWLKYGSTYSPREMAEMLGLDHLIAFVVNSSIDYLADANDEYDFIFLDGDHAARNVYQEIPAALRLLRPNGLILLHDYFPKLQPLWPGVGAIRGPWLAVERLRSEGAELTAIPLGELPWPTKLGSCTTSLALVVRTAST